MTVPESASRLLLHLLTLRGVTMPDVDTAISAGHLTETDWCLTLTLMRGWEVGAADARRITYNRNYAQRYAAQKRGAA